jgi:CRISPR/Cas system-associated exonuclease Cas4 (RecB family)
VARPRGTAGRSSARSRAGVAVKRASDKKLKNYKKTYRSDNAILGAVERHVITRSFTDPERDPGIIHASEISHNDTCRRAICYRLLKTPMEFDEVDTSWWRERTFDDGHETHRKWQTWFWQMGKLYGYFECLVCDQQWFGRAPRECMACGAPQYKLRYKEVPVFDERHHVGGRADGLLDEGLIEVKGIGLGSVRIEAPGFHDKFMDGHWTLQDLWNEIKRPFPSHVRQGMLYSFARGKTEKVNFIYECKWNQAVKIFTVSYNETVIEPVLEACKDIKYAVKKKRPLKRPKWADQKHATCRACPYQGTCWSGESQDKEEERAGADEAPRKRIKVRYKKAA